MKKKILSKAKFYGVVALFAFVVSVVEMIKSFGASNTYTQVFDQSQDSSALIALPIFSIAIVLMLAIPKRNL